MEYMLKLFIAITSSDFFHPESYVKEIEVIYIYVNICILSF